MTVTILVERVGLAEAEGEEMVVGGGCDSGGGQGPSRRGSRVLSKRLAKHKSNDASAGAAPVCKLLRTSVKGAEGLKLDQMALGLTATPGNSTVAMAPHTNAYNLDALLIVHSPSPLVTVKIKLKKGNTLLRLFKKVCNKLKIKKSKDRSGLFLNV